MITHALSEQGGSNDKQTDEMVYMLYGLTDEEIAVVEGRETETQEE